MAALGRAYLDGTLGERRIDEGARLLFEAARAGHPTARYVLAEAFLQSQGIESAYRDYAQAWLETVVAGDTEAALAMSSEEHTSELQSLMRNSYAVYCLKKKTSDYRQQKS